MGCVHVLFVWTDNVPSSCCMVEIIPGIIPEIIPGKSQCQKSSDQISRLSDDQLDALHRKQEYISSKDPEPGSELPQIPGVKTNLVAEGSSMLPCRSENGGKRSGEVRQKCNSQDSREPIMVSSSTQTLFTVATSPPPPSKKCNNAEAINCIAAAIGHGPMDGGCGREGQTMAQRGAIDSANGSNVPYSYSELRNRWRPELPTGTVQISNSLADHCVLPREKSTISSRSIDFMAVQQLNGSSMRSQTQKTPVLAPLNPNLPMLASSAPAWEPRDSKRQKSHCRGPTIALRRSQTIHQTRRDFCKKVRRAVGRNTPHAGCNKVVSNPC